MKSKTYSDVEEIPVTSKVLRGSAGCSERTEADRTAYKKYALESRARLVGSVNKKAGEATKKNFK